MTKTNLQQNTSAKPSGIDWIGDIPGGWRIYPGFYLIRETRKKNLGLAETNLLSLSYGNIIRKADQNFGLTPASFETYQIVNPGQIVFRLTDLQNDKKSLRSGLVKEKGIITSAYTAIKATSEISSGFLNYLYRSYDHVKVFYTLGAGVRQSSDFSELKKVPLLLPPKETQEKIVVFLDEKTEAVDAVIARKKRLIGLLKEKRSSIITHAVTKGLDPNAPTKPSGIDWIGDIPSEWKVRRLKYVSTCNDEALPESTSGDFEFRYVDISNVSLSDGIQSTEELVFKESPSRARRVVRKGDIIVSTVRTYLKAIATITESYQDCIVSTGFSVVRPKKSQGEFLSYYLKGESFIYSVINKSDGVAYPAINSSRLLELPILLPPKETQEKIVVFLDEKTKQIDDMVATIERQVGLLNEYRASLIYHCVTGKISI